MSAAVLAVLVSAAISLKAPLEEAARQFEAANPGQAIVFNFGGSGQLAAQIEQGAPVDLFVSASAEDVGRLLASKRLDKTSRVSLAGNRLVVIVPRGTEPPRALTALAEPVFARIAVGNPKTVPAGRYARQALQASGTLDAVAAKLVYGENSRQVADLVVRGDADAAIVYATDAALVVEKIGPISPVPERLHAPVVYEGAVVTGAKDTAEARAFLGFLTSPRGRSLFEAAGFPAPGPAPPR